MRPFLMLLLLAACAAPDATAPRVTVPAAPSLALATPTGLTVDNVDGLTVSAHWATVAGANGYYLALSDASDVNATKRYQIVYGGATTNGSITAYDGEGGCYLVSVFAWSVSDDDSAWDTTGPVALGGVCPASVLNAKAKKGKR